MVPSRRAPDRPARPGSRAARRKRPRAARGADPLVGRRRRAPRRPRVAGTGTAARSSRPALPRHRIGPRHPARGPLRRRVRGRGAWRSRADPGTFARGARPGREPLPRGLRDDAGRRAGTGLGRRGRRGRPGAPRRDRAVRRHPRRRDARTRHDRSAGRHPRSAAVLALGEPLRGPVAVVRAIHGGEPNDGRTAAGGELVDVIVVPDALLAMHE